MDRLRQLYSEHQLRLYKYFYIRTANEQTAQDLTQDVFYEASKAIHSYRGDASLTSWMYAIANNLLKKYYRSKKYEQSLHSKLQQPSQLERSAEDIVTERMSLQQVHAQIEQLDEASQQILLLRLYSELSFKEIAEIIHCSENYARVQFHRLKKQLRKGGDQ